MTGVTDFDNDGWLDAGWRHYQTSNDGTGVIGGIPSSSNFRGSGVKDYAYADANGDGITDYIYNEGGNLVYRRGTDAGYFASVALVSLPSPAAAIGAGDSDHDGDTDFLLHLENGTFAFVENRSLHQEAGGTRNIISGIVSVPGVTQLQAADFDRDGWEDLLAVTPSQKKLWVLFGEADGGPSGPVTMRNLASAPHSAAVADFDLDGLIDVAYTVPGTGEVRMARNNTNLLITWPDSTIATGLAGVSLLQTGGFGTPNGRTDLLTGNSTTGQVRWLSQSGGIWTGQTVLSSFAPVPGAIMPANGSTRPGDEVFLLAADATTIFLNGYQLNPTWVTLGANLATPVSTTPLAEVMAWADVTGDTRSEVVFVKGDGALGFWNPLTAAGGTIGAADSDIRAITTVDWDRDGRTDILCATSAGVSLLTWKGAWTCKKLLQNGACNSITTINLNGDAWMDAAVGDSATGSVYFLTNTPRALVTRHTSPAQVNLLTGQTGSTASFEATSVGELADTSLSSLADVNAVVSGTDVSFYRANANGAAWEKGTALTAGELPQAVSSIALVSGNTVIGTASPASLVAGRVSVNYAAGAGTLVPITPGSTQALSIRLTLTAGASQSAFNRFFVELGSSIRAHPDDGLSFERTIPLPGVQPVLVNITPVLSPLQQWRQNNFGTWESSGNAADPDGDGNENLFEYVMSQDPKAAGGIGSTAPIGLTSQGLDSALMADLRLLTTYDSKVRLTLEQSTTFSSWTTLSQRTGTGPWTGTVPTSSALSGGRTRFVFNTAAFPSSTPHYYLRLQAEELP